MTADVVARLRHLDVCLVSDALDRLGLQGAVDGILPLWSGSKVVGPVITMSLAAADGRRADRHLGATALDRARPGDVIVIERRDDNAVMASSWGGLLSHAAVIRGVGGVVIDGPCRDVDEIRELGLPVFARGVVPYTARRRVIEEAVGVPVTIAGLPVEAGDVVIADGTGIAFIQAEGADDVVRVAEELASREARMLADLKSGQRPSEVLGGNYEEMLDG